MKIRNGFVSNSSSSSFIINIGIVEDKEKFQKFMNKHELVNNSWEFVIMNQSEYLASDTSYPPWSECDWAGWWGGEDLIENIFKEKPDATVFVKTGSGPDTDEFFLDGDDYCDYDNIDWDDFEEVDQTIGNSHNGVVLIESYFGAGRDG